MKWTFLIWFFCTPLSFLFAAEFNAGFVEGLWLNSDTVFADKPTRIYAAIRNNTGADLSGTVDFFVDGTRIERNSVAALDSRIIESWADWKPTYGKHTITATLSRIELSTVGSSTKDVEVVSARAEKTIFVDYDTDGDGVGNEADTDDDGDGYSDEKEIDNGSDPLDPDDPIAETNEEETTDQESENTAINRGTEDDEDRKSSGPEGLEQYLTESRADRALASLTHTINTTHDRLDAYRETRTQSGNIAPEEGQSPSSGASSTTPTNIDKVDTTKTNDDGFGTIERSQRKNSGDWIENIISIITAVANNAYTLILYLLSLYLSHPIIVQLTLLFLILFILFKIAQRLGRRPQ